MAVNSHLCYVLDLLDNLLGGTVTAIANCSSQGFFCDYPKWLFFMNIKSS